MSSFHLPLIARYTLYESLCVHCSKCSRKLENYEFFLRHVIPHIKPILAGMQ